MAISYLLAPIPMWVIIGNDGLTAGGAKLYTKSSLNKTVDKPVYQDPAGTIPWTNPIVFDANGTQGAFYWKSDSANPSDTYYLAVYDSDDNLLWDLDDYFPPGGSGGGSATTYVDLKNLVVNGYFWRYFNADSNITTTNTILAPGAHAALPEVTTSANGATGPDIRLNKSNATATDRVRFVNFPQGSNPFTGDVTSPWALRFTCSVAGTETYKYLQFPISHNVKVLDNQQVTFVCWAKTETGTADVNVDFRQFYGSSGGGADTFAVASTMNLTTTWTRFVKTLTIPAASGAIGACGNDALYLRILLPVTTTDLYIAKPQVYVGSISPEAVVETFDQVDSVVNAPRTADIQTSLRSSAPLGWIAMDDKSIGNASSSATGRANIDTFPLFKEIYLGVSNTFAPVLPVGRTAPGNDIASCITDFALNKRITLPVTLGRALASAGAGAGLTSRSLGQALGSETISIAAMPAHTHGPFSGGNNLFDDSAAAGQHYGNGVLPIRPIATTGSTGGSAADGNMPPTVFYNVFVKL